MRKSADWMTLWDDRLLEWAEAHDSVSAPDVKDTEYFKITRPHISRRLRKLADHGLLKELGNGVYVITDEGEAYLEGELNASELSEQTNGEDTAEV
ncbi:hypothetical protein [Halobacterium sp. KA-6]|uniref:hypothetical protein n=1 Tax=Halobacterium sp. KA-6 TaxID=2896368 RepID=UPI001E46075A|nr:hypothetical protein [Halobacterium sp. KA-6]MCD2202729.1 hypothetical protein [Halobacterium sp. KA-6]